MSEPSIPIPSDRRKPGRYDSALKWWNSLTYSQKEYVATHLQTMVIRITLRSEEILQAMLAFNWDMMPGFKERTQSLISDEWKLP